MLKMYRDHSDSYELKHPTGMMRNESELGKKMPRDMLDGSALFLSPKCYSEKQSCKPHGKVLFPTTHSVCHVEVTQVG